MKIELNLLIIFLLFISIQHVNTQQQQSNLNIKNIIKKQQKNQPIIPLSNLTDSQIFQRLNAQIQTLDEQFLFNFIHRYHSKDNSILDSLQQQSFNEKLHIKNIKKQPGQYLLLLAKMYLYDILPKGKFTGYTWKMYQSESKYILAYFYLKIAAEKYSNAEAYYYIALLDYYKLTPHETFIANLEKQVDRIKHQQGYQKVYQLYYQEMLQYLKNHRLIEVQHNLFISSLLGHTGASLLLAYMNKQGIGIQKNCTTALAYYLSVIKKTYVDTYQFRSSYYDQQNFQKQLYSKKKIQFKNAESASVVSQSQFFDSQTIKATYQLAENYFIGRAGFKKNYQKAAQLYMKLAAQQHKSSMAMLGMCYFKGQGVSLNRKKAKMLFQASSKMSISQAMLIIMDFYSIQSSGKRQMAIKRMKQIYEKKKDYMNPILKYMLALLVVQGTIKDIKVDDAVVLLGSAAKQGHLMAKISMGLLFADGIDVNYDCKRAVQYFSEEAISYPFFMDKFYLARNRLKNHKFSYSLIKYLQLTTIGDTNSFINALYILDIQKQASLELNQNSWNIKIASQNSLYLQLKKLQIVPEIYSYFLKKYNFVGKNTIKFNHLQKFLEGSSQITQSYYNYLKKKIVKVCSVTKQNSLMNFYEYKMSDSNDLTLLNSIANGQPSKLHVLQSRYLLGQHYHKKSFQLLMKGQDHTKQQYRAVQEYKRATNSQILGKILFYLEQINLSPYGINYEDQLFQFGIIDDLLTFTFILSIVIFVLYYKRSKKLDEIHRKQLEKHQQQEKIKRQHQESLFRARLEQINQSQQNNINQEEKQLQLRQKSRMEEQKDQNQPQIVQQKNQQKGVMIGGSFQSQFQPVIVENYEYYEQEQSNNQQEQQSKKYM